MHESQQNGLWLYFINLTIKVNAAQDYCLLKYSKLIAFIAIRLFRIVEENC